jgi:hypothetical protein
MAVSGGSPSFTTITTTSDASISGLTVGKGYGTLAYNTALGITALGSISLTGNYNTAVGYLAGSSNTSGAQNTFTGRIAGSANTTGSFNAAFGDACLNSNTTGSNNTSVGQGALTSNTTASYNTAVGYEAAKANTTGTQNTAMGFATLKACTTAQNNAAFGDQALQASTTASYNTAVGSLAAFNNTTGAQNVAVGYAALNANTTATGSTAIGWQAGYAATGGANTFLGNAAGNNLTTGSNSTYIGNNPTASSGGVNYEISIGSGFVGQGSGYFAFGVNGIGVVYNNFGSNASWTRASDQRLKTNIQTDTLGLSFITRLQPKTYKWKPSNEVPQEFVNLYSEENKKDTTTVMHGLIAQEVKAALDAEGVSTFGGWHEQSDGCQGVASDMFIFPLINAIKDLKAELDTVKAEIAALKG